MDTIHRPAYLFSLSLPIGVEPLTEVGMQRAKRPIAEHPPLQSWPFATENSLGGKNPQTENLQQSFIKQEAPGSLRSVSLGDRPGQQKGSAAALGVMHGPSSGHGSRPLLSAGNSTSRESRQSRK